jgi:inositol transporter-like SP family MFS transporter
VWRLALAAGLAFYVDAAAVTSVGIALPIWRDHYGLTPWQVGLVTGGFAFAVAAGSLVGGWLGDRFGRGLVFTYDLAVFTIGTLIVITAPDGQTLTVGVIVVGLAAGADVPTALAVISEVTPVDGLGRLTGITQVMWIAAVLATFTLGFAVATAGFAGTRVLIAHLVVLAISTLLLRVKLTSPRHRLPQTAPATVAAGRLRGVRIGLPLLMTGAFFVLWNTASTALGSYGTYFVRTVTGLTQRQATGLVLLTFPIALVMSVIFVRLADTTWRDRLFPVAMLGQIAAFTVGALSGGTVVAGMVLLIVLYSLTNVFGGEAIYKVWSQLLIPPELRATAIGLTYAVGRAVAATFLLVVPALIDHRPDVLLWTLVGCVTASGAIGLVVTRHPRLSAALRPRTVLDA